MTAMDPHTRLAGLVFGAFAAHTVATAARLRVADLFDDDRTSGQIAAAAGTNSVATTRLLRALAALGLLDEPKADVFQLTDTGRLLRRDTPGSLHAFVELFSGPTVSAAWTKLDTAIVSGEKTFDSIFGVSFFEHLSAHPQLSEVFNAAMQDGAALLAPMIPRTYDFSRFSTIADIGGGNGTLLSAVLQSDTSLRGILFDTADGVAQADAVLTGAGVADRCRIDVGDFFTAVPDGAEVYLIKSVIHDWDDEQATAILRNIRAAVPVDGRLLIVEPVLPQTVDGTQPHFTYLSDLNMLVNLGGRERTAHDFETLCTAADFQLSAIHPIADSGPGFSILEAIPT